MYNKFAFSLFVFIFLLSCNQEKPLFKLRSSSRTGIDFKNTIIENDSLNVLKFEYIYNGGGVGVGDFNNDGLQDIFFAGNQVSGRLYLNKGDLKFKDVTVESGIQTPYWTTGVAIVDINGDGWQDIYLSNIYPAINQSAPNQFFMNQGPRNGIPVFEEMAAELRLADEGYSTQAIFFDYDLDNDLDCYLLTNALEEYSRNKIRPKVQDGSARSNDRLYRNDNGHFTNVTKLAGIQTEGWGLGVNATDFNNDGYPDIYCANDFLSNDLLWINNGDGTFSNKIQEYLKHQSHNSMGLDVADINNDALPDLITLDMMPEDNRRQKSMFPAPNYDYFRMYEYLGYQPQYVRNMLQLNNGNGSFSEIGQMAGVYATDWSWAPLLADFDNDGWRDLLITNGYKKDVTDLDFVSYNTQSNVFGTNEMRQKHLDKAFDELLGVKKSNFIYRNNSDLTFEDVTTKWGMNRPSYSNGAAFADFDNDGDLDIVINNLDDAAFFYENTLYVKKKVNKSNFLRLKLNGAPKNPAAFGTKVWVCYNNQIQYAEQTPYRGYLSTVEQVLHFGMGNTNEVDSVVVLWNHHKKTVVNNIKTNQTLVLNESIAANAPTINTTKEKPLFQEITTDINLNWQHQENEFIDFKYQTLLPQRYSLNGPPLAVGDVNGDGLEDLYVGSSSGYSSQLFLQKPDGQFIANKFSKKDTLFEETAALFFDADKDKDIDLYVVHGGYEFQEGDTKYQDVLYLNNGKGEFSISNALPDMNSSGSCVTANDFDHDGDLDLFIGGRVTPRRYPVSPRSYLLQNNNGIFKDITPATLQMPGMVTSAIWMDTDQDGWDDLILAGEFMSVSFYKNNKGIIKNSVPIASSGWWNTLAAGDFDNDGDMDVIAGNLGLNSRFQASETEPVCLYAKDYDNNGSIDPILCRYIQGKEYPTHARDALTNQIPALKKRFLLYADYGKTTFNDIFSKEELNNALVLKSTYMRSAYLENQGGGKFAVRALPNLAQIAPMNAILVRDFNADGHLDLIAIGNSYAPDVQTGAYDASNGWVLQGDGKGNFMPLTFNKSGVEVAGEGRSLVEIRTNAGNLIVAGCNEGKLKVFQMKTPFATNNSWLSKIKK